MKRAKNQRRDELLMAYRIGAFVGFAKLPPWEDVLRRFEGPEQRQPMTEDQIMQTMSLWIARSEGIEARAGRRPSQGRVS